MPIQSHNRGRQRSTRYEICTNGLLTLRGQQLKHLRLGTNPDAKTNIAAIDRVLIDVIGYDGDIVEQSRDFWRVTTFKRGELTKAIADGLRSAKRPLTTLEVAKNRSGNKGRHNFLFTQGQERGASCCGRLASDARQGEGLQRNRCNREYGVVAGDLSTSLKL